MSNRLVTFDITQWDTVFSQEQQMQAIEGLENGYVLFFPNLKFQLECEETKFFNTELAEGTKNISFDGKTQKLRGLKNDEIETKQLQSFISRFNQSAVAFMQRLFPLYSAHIKVGRTSFRPAEIKGRKAPSYRKDDTRLHVDAFPSSPVQGNRILRFFSNINPNQQARVWRLGEDFQSVMHKFLPSIPKPIPLARKFMRLCKITRSYRTLYDHYMLLLHNTMKGDLQYQNTVKADTINFPANSTWIVYTDYVSHAALAGQHALEQTFYLPPKAMQEKKLSPLKQLEHFYKRNLLV